MATKEKTRDELDMQTLRELAALPPNKFCFDCGQRGTTYVNVTIGAFVCSTCGGLLRGLNPPHRVKSLTVCSFTEVEMDRLKSRGNEYCTHIWLGRYDSKSDSDLLSPDNRKEFMIQKYEEKKFYVDPREAIKKMKPRAPAVPVTTSPAVVATTNVSVPRSHTAIPKQRAQPAAVLSQTFSAGDIGKTSVPNAFSDDPFKSDPFKDTNQGENTVDGASFADFNSAFGDSGSTSTAQPASTAAPPNVPTQKKPAPPPPDRYAALADLDNQLHQQTTPEPAPVIVAPTNAHAAFWQQPALVTGAVFAPPTINPFQHGAVPVPVPTWGAPAPNPFQQQSGPTTAIPALNGMPKPSLQPHLNGGSTAAFWGASNVAAPAWVAAVQPDPFLLNSAPSTEVCNPWANSFGATSANPFGTNSFVPGQPAPNPPQTNAKKNPFL
ncbi:hypothetical protein JTE90_019677 [Oedothorax gibbosus]|uniref:Arf-GAP domain-containing protein n=1 Tax=Oedothorax gibbosus TaxID=931172 RepID=A0AAV6V1P3_9ARAC|nr:hypothetical protein JTE90_019677 [Oedothorax gibbosus]